MHSRVVIFYIAKEIRFIENTSHNIIQVRSHITLTTGNTL